MMNEIDPYQSPETSDALTVDERYQPRIFSLSGRIGRIRYIAYSFLYNIIFSVLAVMVGGVIGGLTGGLSADPSAGLNAGVSVGLVAVYIVALAPYIVLTRRRLHDLNRSGWFIVLVIVPLVNLLFTIWVVFFPGTDGPNQYGPAPVKNSLLLVVVLAFLIVVFVGIIAAVAIPAYHDFQQRVEAVQNATP